MVGVNIVNMDNTGNKLVKDILIQYGFEKQVIVNDTKIWEKDGICIYENSWWINDETGESLFKNESENEIPEITFLFGIRIKGDNSFKSGWQIKTDKQLENLWYSLTNTVLNKVV